MNNLCCKVMGNSDSIKDQIKHWAAQHWSTSYALYSCFYIYLEVHRCFMVLLILPTRPCFIIAGSPSSPAMLIFLPHFWTAFSKVEMLLTSCLSSAWNRNYKISFRVKSHKNPYLINQMPFLFLKATLTAAWRRDFIHKIYSGFLNQLLVSTKTNEK